jgi:nucleotide-binding universal stress UspA family protein
MPSPIVAFGEGVIPPEPEGYKNDLREKLYRIQPPDPGIRVVHRFEEGNAVDLILEVAEEASADLIVMGTHGRSGLGRLLMGSVAEQVVRKAPCPVLTVKMPFAPTSSAKPPTDKAERALEVSRT